MSDPYAESGGDWLPPGANPVTGKLPSTGSKPAGGGLFDSLFQAPITTGGDGVSKLASLSKSAGSLSSVMGAIPSISAGGGTSGSGDSTNDQQAAFNYNAAFQVGGSGSQSQAQTADNGMGTNPASNLILYGVLGLAALGLLVYAVKR